MSERAVLSEVKAGKYQYVWIYGTGKTGKKLWDAFRFLGIKSDGFVVSKYDGAKISGADIVELKEIKSHNDDTLFLVSASEKYHREIVHSLETYGYHHYILWNENYLSSLWKMSEYEFADRRNYYDKCCFILAGYKEFLWDYVFERFERFIPANIDVCLLSSGIYSARLAKIAEKNGWSYLSTGINSVTLVQNIAFAIFDGYEWVYKMDEDIFLTENVFQNMYFIFKDAEKNSGYQVGIVSPLIPVNGYGYRVILERYGKLRDFEWQFGEALVGGNPDSEIEKNPDCALFMWDECPQLDEIGRDIRTENVYKFCSVRLSIGCILMRHYLWENMQGFTVSGNLDLGTDEEEICADCMNGSRAIVISHNCVAGHFSFGKQTQKMKEYLMENQKRFSIYGGVS